MVSYHKRSEILDQISKLLGKLRLDDAESVKLCRNKDIGASLESKDHLVYHLRMLHYVKEDAFGCDLFQDTAWSLLLELFWADIERRSVHVSGLCASSKVSQTAALRSLAKLEAMNLIERRADPNDKRRMIVTVTNYSRQALENIRIRIGIKSVDCLDDRRKKVL